MMAKSIHIHIRTGRGRVRDATKELSDAEKKSLLAESERIDDAAQAWATKIYQACPTYEDRKRNYEQSYFKAKVAASQARKEAQGIRWNVSEGNPDKARVNLAKAKQALSSVPALADKAKREMDTFRTIHGNR